MAETCSKFHVTPDTVGLVLHGLYRHLFWTRAISQWLSNGVWLVRGETPKPHISISSQGTYQDQNIIYLSWKSNTWGLDEATFCAWDDWSALVTITYSAQTGSGSPGFQIGPLPAPTWRCCQGLNLGLPLCEKLLSKVSYSSCSSSLTPVHSIPRK